jgi:hypothetical protein
MDVKSASLPLGQEQPSKTYPLWMERFLMLCFIASLFIVPNIIGDHLEGAVGFITAWCLYPFIAICGVELIGRWIQSLQS